MKTINDFIDYIAEVKVSTTANNIYQGDTIATNKRKFNLKNYLSLMKDIKPTCLLLGEAPGYKGCGVTGIPFTSEEILNEIDFFKKGEFHFINKPNNLEKENSASIFWGELVKYSNLPLIWNIYPFHPFNKGNNKSNRKPNAQELKSGLVILEELLKLFPVTKILAVGRVSERKIKNLKVQSVYVRHPSYGGKNDFVRGIRENLTIRQVD